MKVGHPVARHDGGKAYASRGAGGRARRALRQLGRGRRLPPGHLRAARLAAVAAHGDGVLLDSSHRVHASPRRKFLRKF
eukprot:513201-Prymnesium_polylepis.2